EAVILLVVHPGIAINVKIASVSSIFIIGAMEQLKNIFPAPTLTNQGVTMKLVRQCKDTFIRKFGEIGYISSQLTKHDRVYDSVGAVFLEKISRLPQKIDNIVDEILPLFIDVSREVLYQDFIDFVNDLEDSFLVTGYSEEELNRKEPYFSYAMENPKTIAVNFMQQTKKPVFTDTADFFNDYFRQNPTIFGIHMELTSKCNERCLHCYIPHENKTKQMELSFALNVLDQLREMNTVSVTFSGGEPFLHKDILTIIEHARKNDFVVNILSNGTLLDKDNIQVLKDVNINMIQISLYSLDPEIHDAITQVNGSYEKTIKAIELLLNADVPIQISCPAMKLNRKSYKDVSLWAKNKKMRSLCDFIMMASTDFTTSNLAHRLNLNETEDLIKDIINVEEDYQELLELEPKSKDMEKYANQPVCGVVIDNACITASGNLYPCAGFQGYVLGNVREQSLKDIWENSEKVQFIRSIKHSSFPKCLECEARDYCAMCLVRNFNESNGDMFRINKHFCDVAFLNKKLVDQYRMEKQSANG
ncbi:MAG: radical SAM protein, partial [Nanoarchaeota archaeon]|nr:radical SAM protein [Nanoarchaeota archaeon]MBU1976697.1 radical SAM protein [Nanoarchaeota archaeon]